MKSPVKFLFLGVAAMTAAPLGIVPLTSVVHAGSRAHTTKVPTRCAHRITPKGIVKFSDWQFPDTLNPNQSSLAVTTYATNAIFDGLFIFDQKARMRPQMTTAVPTVKNHLVRDRGKTVILKLKKGLLWSNGAEITSQDIKFGLKVGNQPAGGPACTGGCDVIARIDTPNKYTAVLHLKRIYAAVLAYGLPPVFPHKWTSPAGSWNNDPAKAAQLIYQNPDFNYENSQFPTNGPYQISSFVRDDRIVYRPMKYYNDEQCGARLKQLIFSFYSAKPGMIAAAASGQTDITGGGGGYTLADIPTLQSHAGAFKLYQTPSFTLEHLEFNIDSQYKGAANPLANTKVRLALALALDKIGLIRSALGIGSKAASDTAAWSFMVNTPKLKQPYVDKAVNGQWDPLTRKFVAGTGSGRALSDAKKLLSQTPFKSGFDLDLATTTGNPNRVAAAGVIASNWKRLGVNVTTNYIPASTLFDQWAGNGTLHHGDFQVGMFGFTGLPDPDQGKFNLVSRYIDRAESVHVPLNQNYSGIRDRAIDKAFSAGAASVNNRVRARNYSVIQREVNQKAYWIGLYYKPNIATTSHRVKGFVNNPTQEGPSWNIYKWEMSS